MKNPKLIEILSSGGDKDDKVRLQYEEETGELYVNDRKVVTEVGLTKMQKFLAYGASIAIIVQGVMSVAMAFLPHHS